MASGSQRRFTTVHDRAALRVHPDGTRVTTRESRYATQDLRGNRIAVNAGGTGNVKKRKRAALSDDEAQPLEEFDIETDEYQPSETQTSSIDSCAGEIEGESDEEGSKRKHRKDSRTAKRTHFHQDFGFIPASQTTIGTVPVSNDPLLPSSDLLKCLHHFAAKYYSDKGQLTDASRIARQRKKAKKNGDTGSRSGSRSGGDSISGEEPDHGGTNIASMSPTMPQMQKGKGRRGADLVKDMYKMFDGSALVALGVLVHERIERTLQWDFDSRREQELESGDGDSDSDEEG